MAHASFSTALQDFAEIVKFDEIMAPLTSLKIGGPADVLVQPRTMDELQAVVRRCVDERINFRVLGGGCNVLVQDQGVRGVVLRLREPAFTQVRVEDRLVHAGSGATLAALISEAARHELAGVETLVGIPGTVGGALRHHVGERSGEIGQLVRRIGVIDRNGQLQTRDRDEFADGSLDDPVLISATFELERDGTDAIVKRMQKAWIQRKGAQPFSFQAACRVFKNPRGLSASAMLGQAGLAGTKVGGAEVSDRDANYIIAHPGTTSRDVMRLIEVMRSRVLERFNTELDLEVAVW